MNHEVERVPTSGVTRGLSQGGQNLAEVGPLATVLVCNN